LNIETPDFPIENAKLLNREAYKLLDTLKRFKEQLEIKSSSNCTKKEVKFDNETIDISDE